MYVLIDHRAAAMLLAYSGNGHRLALAMVRETHSFATEVKWALDCLPPGTHKVGLKAHHLVRVTLPLVLPIKGAG